MMAKATNEPHASPVKLKRSTSKDVNEHYEMNEKEKELALKYIKLIQGRIPSKEPILLSDVSPGEDTMADMSASMMSSVISSSSQESVYASDFLEQVTLPACLSAPASSGCPRFVASYYLDSKSYILFSRFKKSDAPFLHSVLHRCHTKLCRNIQELIKNRKKKDGISATSCLCRHHLIG